MRRPRVVMVVVLALVSSACANASVPSGGAAPSTPTAPASATSATDASAIPGTTPEPSPVAAFQPLDTPTTFSTSSAEAVDGTTAVGWVQIGIADEEPAIWDTTTGAIRVLAVPANFVHPSGNTFVRLVGISGTTAVGTGILGTEKRGQERAMAWNTETEELTILDVPAGFTQATAHAISGTTAIGEAWTAHGEKGIPVAWDTQTGAVRPLEMAGYFCGHPVAVSDATVVGTRCVGDAGRPILWSPITAEPRDLDLLPESQDGVPSSVDGTTAVGECCYGEEGTPLPLLWDTTTGAVEQLDLPASFENGTAHSVSGTVAVGAAGSTPLVWDLATGHVSTLSAPSGYDQSLGLRAVSGPTIVGFVCEPPASSTVNARCVAAAWTLP